MHRRSVLSEKRATKRYPVRRISGRTLVTLGLAWSLSTGAATDAQTGAPVDQQIASSIVDDIAAEVARIRGLEFERTVPVAVVDDDAARQHFIDRLHGFQTPEQLADIGRAYELLGLLPVGFDVLGAYLGALREQAGGYYDPESASYYLLSDMPAELAPAITAHELTHALEDQHFDLDARLRESLIDDDRMFAVGSVHEGSAMLVMTVVVAQRLVGGAMETADLARVAESEAAKAEMLLGLPPVLLRQMVGPYVLGPSFLTGGELAAIASQGYPVERVNGVFASGPLSSEQILHPEKYWDAALRDDPRPVTLDGVGRQLGSRWSRAADGVLGEVGLALLVGAATPVRLDSMVPVRGEEWTNEAARGWGGDRWELWRNGKSEIVLLATVWDGEEDARQFVESLPETGGLRRQRSGDRVAVVAGKLGARKTDRLLARMLEMGGPAAE
jgi:hypothetical protein